MRRRSRWLFLSAALLALEADAAPAVIPLKLPSGKELKVEVMVEDADRAMGLMFRDALPSDRGLLFVFDRPDFHSFWMKNCKFPIDIVWMDGERKVVHVERGVPPCKNDPCPSYRPMRRALYVLEIGSGQARKEKADVGAVLTFAPPL